MAERRMFSKSIVDSDRFLDMPASTRLLYYDLGVRADDDGFVNNPRKIARMTGASGDDIKLLIAKSFIIQFGSGVIVITHWKINNYIRPDRYKPTIYQEEFKQLGENTNREYFLILPEVVLPPEKQEESSGIPTVYQRYTQDRVDKDRVDKDRVDKDRETDPSSQIIQLFNSICTSLPRVTALTAKRKNAIAYILKMFSIEQIEEVFTNAQKSSFLTGKKGKWEATFDWILQEENFVKILEGNYKDFKAKDSLPEREYDFKKLEDQLLAR